MSTDPLPGPYDDITEALGRIEKIAADILAALTPVTPPAPQNIVIGQEPPVGTVLQDRDGDTWFRNPDGWTLKDSPTSGDFTWVNVLLYGPLTMIELGEEKPS